MTAVIVYHSGYGCDTGCCGHRVEMGDDSYFVFGHPYGDDPRTYAEDLVRSKFGEEHVADLDWESCEIVDC